MPSASKSIDLNLPLVLFVLSHIPHLFPRSDTPPLVRHKVSDAVAHIARNLSCALWSAKTLLSDCRCLVSLLYSFHTYAISHPSQPILSLPCHRPSGHGQPRGRAAALLARAAAAAVDVHPVPRAPLPRVRPPHLQVLIPSFSLVIFSPPLSLSHLPSPTNSSSVVPSVFGSQLNRYINEIAGVLNTSMQDAANIDVQLAAARAFTTFIQTIASPQRAAFTGLVPVVLQVCRRSSQLYLLILRFHLLLLLLHLLLTASSIL